MKNKRTKRSKAGVNVVCRILVINKNQNQKTKRKKKNNNYKFSDGRQSPRSMINIGIFSSL